jgi:hypothetical protein
MGINKRPGRKLGHLPAYTPDQIQRYKSQQLRYSKALKLFPTVFGAVPNLEYRYQSDRAPTGYWTVKIRDGLGTDSVVWSDSQINPISNFNLPGSTVTDAAQSFSCSIASGHELQRLGTLTVSDLPVILQTQCSISQYWSRPTLNTAEFRDFLNGAFGVEERLPFGQIDQLLRYSESGNVFSLTSSLYVNVDGAVTDISDDFSLPQTLISRKLFPPRLNPYLLRVRFLNLFQIFRLQPFFETIPAGNPLSGQFSCQMVAGTQTSECDCPDFAKKQRAIVTSKFQSEQIDRDWSATDAGSQTCKHIIATKLYRGEAVPVPNDPPL